MNDNKTTERWLYSFGKKVSKELIKKHVTSLGNHLWHLFSWELVPHLKGNDAREAFNKLEYLDAIKFYNGFSNRIDNISTIDKLSAELIDTERCCDVYIVAKDFSWTYVRTHEKDCGPYFCINNI